MCGFAQFQGERLLVSVELDSRRERSGSLLTITIMNPMVQITTVFHKNCIIATNEKNLSMLVDRDMIR